MRIILEPSEESAIDILNRILYEDLPRIMDYIMNTSEISVEDKAEIIKDAHVCRLHWKMFKELVAQHI